MKQAITRAKAMYIEGRHLYSCFASQDIQKQGWKLMQQAKRILRRLNVNYPLV